MSTSVKAWTISHDRSGSHTLRLHYVVTGSGPVVLCMHGWPQNHREFLPIINALADRYAFIAPDLRGYADSDKLRAADIAGMARDDAALN
jgi:pimeloyl-ACP methyl ester carboxylesterase